MFVARVAGVILVIALGVLIGAYLATRDRRYLRWIRLILRFALAFACAVMAVYVVERLMLVI